MAYAGRMKRIAQFLVWLAAVAVFLLLTAHFTLKHALNTPKFKAAVTGFVERSTGRAADYGRLDYTLFPFTLVLENAALKEKDSPRNFAAMEKLSVLVDFRNQEISALRLERPVIRIVQRTDGSYNYSDLVARPAAEPAPSGSAPAGTAPTPAEEPAAPPPAAPAAPSAPPFVLRLLQIENARIEFEREKTGGAMETFTLDRLDFFARDLAPDQPLRMDGRAAIGRKSAVQFEVSGAALADYHGNLGAWPVESRARLDLRDMADVQALWPDVPLPFSNLWITLHLHGALADRLQLELEAQSADAADARSGASECRLAGELTLPGPVAQHLLGGDPLPDPYRFDPPACPVPAGAVALTEHPALALLLKHAQATAQLSVARLQWGLHGFSNGTATVYLRQGTLTVPDAGIAAYGGRIEARGHARLLACPLTYRLDRFVADSLSMEQVLAAGGAGGFAGLSGRLHLEASLAGAAVAAAGLRTLEADVQARIENLQTRGRGGSLMDQVWMQLDHPVLVKLIPGLKPKVEQARQSGDNITTTRYDEATATLALRQGVGTLSKTRLAQPGWRLELAGILLPFDDRLDLTARLLASPAETRQLTGDRDLSAYLPYEGGGLLVPFFIRGALHDPQVRPDMDRLLKNAVSGVVSENLAPALEKLSAPDQKHMQEGLQLLQQLAPLLQKP